MVKITISHALFSSFLPRTGTKPIICGYAWYHTIITIIIIVITIIIIIINIIICFIINTSVTRRYRIGDDGWHAVSLSGRGSAKGGIMQKTKVDKNDVQKVDVP